jgi:hypothetical protein
MAADPGRQIRRPLQLRVGVIAGPQYRDEEDGLVDLAGARVDDGERLARVVDEEFLARPIGLAEHRIDLLLPPPIALAKPRVLIALRMRALVLDPQQLERDPFPTQLRVDGGPVRLRPSRVRPTLGTRIQEALQGPIVQLGRERPAEPGRLRPVQQAAHGRQADPGAPGDLAHRQLPLPVQPKDVANLPHRQSLPRHDRYAPLCHGLVQGIGHRRGGALPVAVRNRLKRGIGV